MGFFFWLHESMSWLESILETQFMKLHIFWEIYVITFFTYLYEKSTCCHAHGRWTIIVHGEMYELLNYFIYCKDDSCCNILLTKLDGESYSVNSFWRYLRLCQILDYKKFYEIISKFVIEFNYINPMSSTRFYLCAPGSQSVWPWWLPAGVVLCFCDT
jgi:hypothetical protein